MAIVGGHGGHTTSMAGPEAVPPAGPAAAPRDKNAIGVVFVHGIGSQKPGETLISWARPLIRLVQSWSATTSGVDAPNDPVLDSVIDFTEGVGRPFVKLTVPAHGTRQEQRWVLTEAWWAAKVSPPPVSDMFRWLFPREMIRIITGILRGFGTEFRLYRWIELFFLSIFVVPVTILVGLAYVIFRVMRAVPIQAIQEFALVRAVEFFLSDWFGDVRLLLADRAQAANVRAAIASAIMSVQGEGCGTIVVIGHSGGTIAGYMTLTDATYHLLPVNRFITHGQALGLAWRLGHASEPSRPDRVPERLYAGDRLRTPIHGARPSLQWTDFWGTHDPAPAGGFGEGDVSVPADANGESIRVFNRMSLRNDHGAYWDNDEAFVLPVARLIDTAPSGEPRTASRFFPQEPSPSRVEHREGRVKLLQFAWVGVMASAVVSVPVAILDPLLPNDQTNLAEAGRLAYSFVGWLAGTLGFIWDLLKWPALPKTSDLSSSAALVIGIVAMLAIFWIVARILGSCWNAWDEREREIALQPNPRWRPTLPLTIQVGLCAGASLALVGFAASGRPESLVVPGIAVALAFVVRLVSPRGEIRRPGALEVSDRDAIIDGAPGIAEA